MAVRAKGATDGLLVADVLADRISEPTAIGRSLPAFGMVTASLASFKHAGTIDARCSAARPNQSYSVSGIVFKKFE